MTHPSMYGNTKLTVRDLVVAKFVSQGLRNPDIAIQMGSTENMIKNYLRIIYDKLGFYNRVELALWYIAKYEKVDCP